MTLLLAPCGNRETLMAAIGAGADAVYFGISGMNMRASARNFEISELQIISKICSENSVTPFLTLNTIVFPGEESRVNRILEAAAAAEIKNIIAWDLSVVKQVRDLGLSLTVSTQAGCSNLESAIMWESLGAKTIVFARELSLNDISQIKQKLTHHGSNLKVEVFAHGAMCVAVSGRCFFSEHLYGKSGNRGECLQPCRRKYIATDMETGNQVAFDRNTIFSPKDLCTLPILDKLVSAGIDILKIEGRNRDPYYVHTVTSCYRKGLDAINTGTFTDDLKTFLMTEIEKVYSKGYHTGFYLGMPTSDDYSNIENNASRFKKIYVGRVEKFYSKINVIDLNAFSFDISIGDHFVITGTTTGLLEGEILSIENEKNESISTGIKGGLYGIKPSSKSKVRTGDKFFVLKEIKNVNFR